MSEPGPKSGPGLRWLTAFAVGVVAILVLRLWRGFFWPHAILVGLAIAALVYSAWRTFETMRRREER